MNKRAFTIVELLAAIAIVLLVSSFLLSQHNTRKRFAMARVTVENLMPIADQVIAYEARYGVAQTSITQIQSAGLIPENSAINQFGKPYSVVKVDTYSVQVSTEIPAGLDSKTEGTLKTVVRSADGLWDVVTVTRMKDKLQTSSSLETNWMMNPDFGKTTPKS